MNTSSGRFLRWLLTLVLIALVYDNILWYQDFPVANVTNGDSFDPLCLTRLMPGQFQSNEDPNVWHTVNRDCLRRFHGDSFPARPYRVLCLGCSYTFGSAVKDEETYVWRLNELIPNVEFVNGGVGGYGPLTILLREKDLLSKNSYDLVMYAFLDDHRRRNSIPQAQYEPGMSRYRKHHAEWDCEKTQL